MWFVQTLHTNARLQKTSLTVRLQKTQTVGARETQKEQKSSIPSPI